MKWDGRVNNSSRASRERALVPASVPLQRSTWSPSISTTSTAPIVSCTAMGGTLIRRVPSSPVWTASATHGRLLTPAAEEWREAGRLLARLGRRHGFEQVRRGRLGNDALIAVSAYRVHAVLVTANAHDFQLIAAEVDIELRLIPPA